MEGGPSGRTRTRCPGLQEKVSGNAFPDHPERKGQSDMSPIDPYILKADATIRDAMTCIDKNGKGICLVVTPDVFLLGSVSDGDIRRAILKGENLDRPVLDLITERSKTAKHGPVTAPPNTSTSELLHLMDEHGVRQI